MKEIDWHNIKVVIFDVDGTLYNQSRLRKKMGRMLLGHYFLRPWNAYDLQIIRVFRKERELMNFNPVPNIEDAQYDICAKKIKAPATTIKKVIEKWMYQAPLPYLRDCSFPGIQDFFEALRAQDLKIAIYSDYPATDKLLAMGLKADLVLSSTDREIDALKPDPKALAVIAKHFQASPQECLFIGDRDELDGACARKAGMHYYILNEEDKKSNFYQLLSNKLKKYKLNQTSF